MQARSRAGRSDCTTKSEQFEWRLRALAEGHPDGNRCIAQSGERVLRGYQQWIPDVRLGLQNLLLHRLRSLLTMLGMIFGVAAVVSMLSIGAGARQKVMALIEQMGVRNLIVEAKETTEWQAHSEDSQDFSRTYFSGLPRDSRRRNDIVASTPRKRMTPSKTIPKAAARHARRLRREPELSPRSAAFSCCRAASSIRTKRTARRAGLRVGGRCAGASLFGAADPIDQYVKVNEQWFRVIGVASPNLVHGRRVSGVPTQDLNNIIYVPLNAAILRLEDSYSDVQRRN